MVKIITDTTACLPVDYARANNLTVIPQVIHFGDSSYFEGIDIDIAGFMERLASCKELPKTAAPPPELYTTHFAAAQQTGEDVICIHPSAAVSGTVRSASLAAQDFPTAKIKIIDTRVVAAPLATLVQQAVYWKEQGCSAAEIEQELTLLSAKAKVYFLVDTLDFLARGGRIGGASALLGSLMQIKPILTLKDGKVESFEKPRTQRKAIERLIQITLAGYPKDEGFLSVMHAGVPAQAEALADRLKTELQISNIPIVNIPPAIVVHGGPGILGVSFFSD